MDLKNLMHDLNNLKAKIDILSSELTEESLEAKDEVYQDLVKTLKQAEEILQKLNE